MAEKNIKPRKSLLKKWWFWVIISPIILILLLLSIVKGVGPFTPKKPPEDFLITHNLFDLDQIVSVSRFRSCQGHRSMSQGTKEPASSMAHYLMTNVNESKQRKGEIKVYAPFDGYITDSLNNQGFSFVPKSSKLPWWPFNQYRINLAHVEALPQFKGTKPVKVGELVGHELLSEYYEDGGQISMDVRLGVLAWPPQYIANNGEPLKNMDSIFHYMSDEVFAEFTSITPGLTDREQFIIPVELREKSPCVIQGKGPYFDYKASEQKGPEYSNFVILRVDNNDQSALDAYQCSSPKASDECKK
ncbi:MAG: hypothetical protein WC752_02970 [Patescibacteria group bacterium]|jgi:hypothetical protein